MNFLLLFARGTGLLHNFLRSLLAILCSHRLSLAKQKWGDLINFLLPHKRQLAYSGFNKLLLFSPTKKQFTSTDFFAAKRINYKIMFVARDFDGTHTW